MLTRILGIIVLLSATGCASTIVERYDPAMYGVHAFSGQNDQSDDYAVGALDCTVTLVPPRVQEASAVGTTNWVDVLSAEFPDTDGWTYNSAINKLSDNSLEIKTYDAQGSATAVGSDVHIRYVPGADDPSREIHWIQVVTNNHSINPNRHGARDNKVDTFSATGQPYYDDGGAANAGMCSPTCSFYDKPRRVDALEDHDWDAVLYVVEAPASGPGLVTLRAPAMSWGWRNRCTERVAMLERYFHLEESASLISERSIVLDSTAQLSLDGQASFRVKQGELESTATLTELELALDVGPQTESLSPEADLIKFSVDGVGTFSDFILGEETFSGTQLVLSGGSGVIHSASGGLSASIDGEIVAENQESAPVTVHLYGELNNENYTVSLTAETTMIAPRSSR